MFQIKIKNRGIAKLYLAVLLFFYFGFVLVLGSPLNVAASGADLYLSPSSGTYKTGQSFTVGVYVSSPSQSMNAASGNIYFPADLLSVSSISKSGSIISLWTREPAASGASVGFEGIVLNPGYQGSSGKLISITFKVKGTGNAGVGFNSGSVLANDGNGTNILSSLGSANFVVGSQDLPAPADQTPAPQPSSGLPAAPHVTSSTHPDSASWYANANPNFKWSLPSGVTAVNFFGDQNPTTDPNDSAPDGLKSEYTYTNVKDGTWYFHIRYKNNQGWGPITHFKFQVDVTKPESLDAALSDAAAAKFSIKASDATSGIDHYELVFDKGSAQTWKDDGSGVYQAAGLGAGNHSLDIKAYDKAGNFIEKQISFDLTGQAIKAQQTSGILISASLIQAVKTTVRDLLIGLIGLLLLYLLYRAIRKFARWISGLSFRMPLLSTVRRADLIDSIEILERAERRRDLTHEEEKVLHNLRQIVYGRRPKEHAAALLSKMHKDERIVEGIFDGQNMIGSDGEIYSVPANYASKSKMVEGDQLRASIHKDGSVVYKQVGPVERHKRKGILGEQDDGEFRVIADGKAYRVLPASLTFFHAQPGDEVAILIPKGTDAQWAALEEVVKKHKPEEEEVTPAKRYNRKKKTK